MDDWFENLVRDIIWKAIAAAVGELENKAAAAIEGELAGLTLGQVLSTDSPLVAVVAVDDASITLLIRGRFALWGGAIAPFLRIQIRISKTVNPQLHPPITILSTDTVIGDLQITKADVFTAELGFGWNQGAWLGRGAFKVLPAGFGLDLLLGGLDDRGLMVGIDLHLPVPIPLGDTGVALIDVGGEFAYNFVPQLLPKLPKSTPFDARDYVAWAKDIELGGWQPGPPDETAVGIGIHAGFGDLSSAGRMISLDPIGLAVLTPGPIFILGGQGKIVDSVNITAEGYVAVDIPSGSIALGLDVHASEKSGNFELLEAKGSLDAYFSFQHPADWYIHFGTNTTPVKGEVLQSLASEFFLMIGHAAVPAPDGTLKDDGIFLGIGFTFGNTLQWSIIEAYAAFGFRVAVALGWNPLELEGAFSLYGELGLKIWAFELKITVQADLTGHVAKPTKLTGDVLFCLDLPWPLPHPHGTLTYSLGDTGGPPDLKSPLLVGGGL